MEYTNTENRFKAKLKIKHDDPQQIQNFDRAFNEFVNKWAVILGADSLKVVYEGMSNKIAFRGGR